MIHRVSRVAAFSFDFPAGTGQKQGSIKVSGSTSMYREDFPQLVKTVIATYWPPVVQNENCQVPDPERSLQRLPGALAHSCQLLGFPKFLMRLMAKTLVPNRISIPMVGNHLNIIVHLHLIPASSVGQ
jgi:hypothetical protein